MMINTCLVLKTNDDPTLTRRILCKQKPKDLHIEISSRTCSFKPVRFQASNPVVCHPFPVPPPLVQTTGLVLSRPYLSPT